MVEGKSRNVLEAVKQAVASVEPDAVVRLFGSRAFGRGRKDSDWDFLVLLDGPVDQARKQRVRRVLYLVEWECGQVISSVIYSRSEWDGPRGRAMPFRQAVEAEAVSLRERL